MLEFISEDDELWMMCNGTWRCIKGVGRVKKIQKYELGIISLGYDGKINFVHWKGKEIIELTVADDPIDFVISSNLLCCLFVDGTIKHWRNVTEIIPMWPYAQLHETEKKKIDDFDYFIDSLHIRDRELVVVTSCGLVFELRSLGDSYRFELLFDYEISGLNISTVDFQGEGNINSAIITKEGQAYFQGDSNIFGCTMYGDDFVKINIEDIKDVHISRCRYIKRLLLRDCSDNWHISEPFSSVLLNENNKIGIRDVLHLKRFPSEKIGQIVSVISDRKGIDFLNSEGTSWTMYAGSNQLVKLNHVPTIKYLAGTIIHACQQYNPKSSRKA